VSKYREFTIVRGDVVGSLVRSVDGLTLTGEVGPNQWVFHGALLEDTQRQLDLCVTRYDKNGWTVIGPEAR
jgi:hypothetical protein